MSERASLLFPLSSKKTKSLESEGRFLYRLMPRQLASARDYCGDIAFSCAPSWRVSPTELASHDFWWLLSFNDVGRASDANRGLWVRKTRIYLIVTFTILPKFHLRVAYMLFISRAIAVTFCINQTRTMTITNFAFALVTLIIKNVISQRSVLFRTKLCCFPKSPRCD